MSSFLHLKSVVKNPRQKSPKINTLALGELVYEFAG